MAVAAEGFSIREYAWRMRSVDVGKCWPFDDTDENEIKSKLPPITVEKFTWWFDDLGLEGSNNENSRRKLARDEGTSRNERDNMDESDNAIDQRVICKKGKAPKKRSIVELFAVAPQVEMADGVDDYEDDNEGTDSDKDREDGYPNSKFSGVKSVDLDTKGKKKEKMVRTKLKKQKKVIKKYKKKEKARKLSFVDFKIAKKERSNKIRMHSPVNFAAYHNNSLDNTGLPKDNLDAISTLRKKSQVKDSSTQKKRKPALALRGILKNHTKVLQIQRSSCILQDVSEENCSGTHEGNKHVTFSVNDDILGQMWELPRALRSDAVACLKDPGQEIRESSDIVNANGDKIISNSTGNAQQNLFDGCLSLNPDPLLEEHLNLSDGSFGVVSRDMYACSPGYPTSPEGYWPHPVVQVLENSLSGSKIWGESSDLIRNRERRLAEVSYEDFVKTNPQPSSSYLSNWNPDAMQVPLFPSKTIRRNCSDLQHYPFNHFSPKELMHTIYGDNSMNENFVGLPLNSQGELIKLNTSGQRLFDLLTRPTTAVAPSSNVSSCGSNYSDFSSWDGGTQPQKHFEFFPMKDTVNEKPYFAVPYGFGGVDYQSKQRTNVGTFAMSEYEHSIHPVESNLDLMILPQHHGPDHVSLHGTQSTMRLMGKEFTVGKIDLQPFEVGNVWTDKQIIAEHLSGNDVVSKSRAQSDFVVHSALGKPGEAFASSSRIKVNEDMESVLQMKIPQSSHLLRENPDNVSSLYNYDPGFHESVKVGREVSDVISQALFSARDDLSKSVSSSYNSLPHATESGFSFPFLHPLSEGHSRTSWWPNTSRSIYPPTSYATQNGTFTGSFPSFPDLGSIRSLNVPRPEAFGSYNSFQPNSALQNPAGIGVSSHPPPMPMIPRSTLNRALQSRYGDSFRFNDRINLHGCNQGPNPCKRTSKRPAASLQSFMKPSKIPDLKFHENYSSISEGAVDVHANREGDVGSTSERVNTNQGDQFEVVQNRFKVSSGPVKLTAGAKHILKPCQKAGHHNSSPIQSTIRFTESTTTGDTVLQSEESAKIYKF